MIPHFFWFLGLLLSPSLAAQVLFNCSDQPDDAFVPIVLVSNNGALNLTFIPYGGTVTSLLVGLKNGGPPVDVVLGFDDPTQYCRNAQHSYFGALIGRVANRIAGGAFDLNGAIYHTPINEPPPNGGNDTLHGGFVGFDRRVWTVSKTAPNTATLTLEFADGDQGFPGALAVAVTYTLDDGGAWWIDYRATTTLDTVVSLTQHTYFNLNGCQAPATEHVLWMPHGSSFVAVDAYLVPTGSFTEVALMPPMDFTAPKSVGKDIADAPAAAATGGGYDNAFVFPLAEVGNDPVRMLASLQSPLSGVAMEILSDQPSLQVYSGNYLDGSLPAKADQGGGSSGGVVYDHWYALALEAQLLPDAVHHLDDPQWAPTPRLRAGEQYHQRTGYRFAGAAGTSA